MCDRFASNGISAKFSRDIAGPCNFATAQPRGAMVPTVPSREPEIRRMQNRQSMRMILCTLGLSRPDTQLEKVRKRKEKEPPRGEAISLIFSLRCLYSLE
jgi:hypothetical protein